MALDDGPRGEIELQMWSDFARSAQEQSKAAGLGPERDEGRGGGGGGGGGRRGGSSKGWGWRWGGSPSEGENEDAAGMGPGEGSPAATEAQGRQGDGRSSLHFPPVWILTSDPAVDRAIRESMPHLQSFFVPGAFGGPDTTQQAVAVAGGSVARASSASVAAEAAVEAGARAEASRLTVPAAAVSTVEAAAARVPPPPPPPRAEHAADELANRGRRTTTVVPVAPAAPAVDQQHQPAEKAEEKQQTERTPPGEGALPSRRRASASAATSEAGGGGAGGAGGAASNAPEFSTWSAVLERFLSENHGVDVFGIFGEGSLPAAALFPPAPAAGATIGRRSGASIDRTGDGGGAGSGRVIESLLWPVLSKSVPPTVVLSRARGWWVHEKGEEEEEDDEEEEGQGEGEGEGGNGGVFGGGGGGGAGEWMSDRFVTQVRERTEKQGFQFMRLRGFCVVARSSSWVRVCFYRT